jgi:hypothetical protein
MYDFESGVIGVVAVEKHEARLYLARLDFVVEKRRNESGVPLLSL